MAVNKTSRRKVLLDASNIMFASPDSDKPDGRILLSAFEVYEKLGYTVEAIMTSWAYRRFQREKHPGLSALKKLEKSDKLQPVPYDDDKHLLDLMVQDKSWLVTHDKFDDRTVDGVTKERQRTLFPGLPWDEIDKYTRGTEKRKDGSIISHKHWSVRGTTFYDPEMPKAPKRLFQTTFGEINDTIEDLDRTLIKIDALLESHQDDELPDKKKLKNRLAHMQHQALELKSQIPADRIDENSLPDHTVVELKAIAKEMGITGCSNKKKDQLIQMIKDHINPSPEKIKADAEKRRAEEIRSAKIRASSPKAKPPSKTKSSSRKRKLATTRGPPKKSSQKPKPKSKTETYATIVIDDLKNLSQISRPRTKKTLQARIEELRKAKWKKPKPQGGLWEGNWNWRIINWLNQKEIISINDDESIRYHL
ncbi:MAG: Rho termination factor N-terminal domain-containing protein [Candidatus Thermoplasmatota archaeon]|nr:Rho termination factor N-terminal domain-containing protein [Candidatus Thermoplasmatota archaeon]